ncbi:Fanconi anemia group A protein isoform X2 [Denticeps clupeoides]|uniref:Fanconi anemia group A protein isoform X2 n=1 Tax=Denticeps clupeoides TaxID=299321 RepID=UPI0010A52579|nr:Fanconi anemia group A protein isoform X2 [Denticeps clupeoides]
MSLDAPPAPRASLSSLLAGRAGKRPREQAAPPGLQQAAVQLLNRNQNLAALLLEVGSSPKIPRLDAGVASEADETPDLHGGVSLLVDELSRRSEEMGVPVGVFSVKVVCERLLELTGPQKEDEQCALFSQSQRAQLGFLLQSIKELQSLGVFCPQLFWEQYWRAAEPKLEVFHFLLSHNILSLELLLERADGLSIWMERQMQSMCGLSSIQEEDEIQMRQQILANVASALVRVGFEEDCGFRKTSPLCSSMLDSMLSWLLDISSDGQASPRQESAAEAWLQMFDASAFDRSVSSDAIRRFFSHSLTQALTHCPRLKVSDAIAMQSEWSFVKTCRLLTQLFRKLCALFSVEELLSQLKQVLETHEVNWQHVLSFLSTLLVYHPHTQPCLKDLLSRLLTAAFEAYDLESMVAAFLLARQASLEGPAVFSSYSDWFKLAFGGASSYHGNSKKSLLFLLKFLSDLVPFDPPQYLKVHVLHPPYIPAKHRSLLQEYVSLAKTRLADLKVSVEEMGLYEDTSGAAESLQPQNQAQQDVEKAISLFVITGKISATVMEASIFRRPYFLSRFLHALLIPRVLPAQPDARMNFIEALLKSDKIPAVLYSSYTEGCSREKQKQLDGVSSSVEGSGDGDVSELLARVTDTLSHLCPERPEEAVGQTVIQLHVDREQTNEVHSSVSNALLRGFCQCLLDSSTVNPPTRQGEWAIQFAKLLLGHRKLFTTLLHRLWDLLRNQGEHLSSAHILGLAVLIVQLHMAGTLSPLVQLVSPLPSRPVGVSEALGAALPCSSNANLTFSLGFCVAAVNYGLCVSGSQRQDCERYVPNGLFKKLLYLVPRLVPEARNACHGDLGGLDPSASGSDEVQRLWRRVTDASMTLNSSALELWRSGPFRLLHRQPLYQLTFSEWLANELRVQRSQDALCDLERQEYQQWACQQHYLPTPLDEGGCGGDLRLACTLIVNAVMDLTTGPQTAVQSPPRTDTCLPDILARLQELVYELQETRHFQGEGHSAGQFLFDLVVERCTVTSDPEDMSSELRLQETLHDWNRVMLSLSPGLLVTVRSEGGRKVVDCRSLFKHISQYQRRVCCPVGLLPYQLTAHFLKAIVSVSVSCERPTAALNRALADLRRHCPLLLVSAGRWWLRLSPVILSQWNRLTGGQLLPEELQLIVDSSSWTCRTVGGEGKVAVAPPAHPLLLAACLHQFWGASGCRLRLRTSLEQLRHLHKDPRALLVFLLYFSVMDLLSGYLNPQGAESVSRAMQWSAVLLSMQLESPDWLQLFCTPGTEQGQYQSVSMVTTDESRRLMCLAFYCLVPSLDETDLSKALSTPGFLYTAVGSYCELLRLFLNGETPYPRTGSCPQQVNISQILDRAQQVVLRSVSLRTDHCLTQRQRSQLVALCGELDPQVAAALSQLSPLDLDSDFSHALDCV